MAADCGVMVIDMAKGIESQTEKLFRVCALRRIPVLTFVNKVDRPGRSRWRFWPRSRASSVLSRSRRTGRWIRVQTFAVLWIGEHENCHLFERQTRDRERNRRRWSCRS